MIFDWDPNKDTENQRKHGVSFADASTAFSDDYNIVLPDEEHSTDDEDRFTLLGLAASLRVLVVCHCRRGHDDGIVRIISAWRANKRQQATYSRCRGRG